MSSILTYETSSTTNSSYDINGKNNNIIKNPLSSSSFSSPTSRYQSTTSNKYQNLIPTHPLSNLKQILSDQQSNINSLHVC